jgi:hypothetical protein
MKITPVLAFAGLLWLVVPARAERPDCALFPDTHSRWACYDNVSRAPNPEQKESMKPGATKAKAAAGRKTRAN